MDAKRLAAILLIVAGTLSLVYGGFTYNKQTQNASIGPIDISVQEHRTVSIPLWAGVGAIVVGAVLLLPLKKSSA
jgi:drug/metabolite transporter (DMT)-like permease